MLLEDILDELKWFVIMFIAVTVSLCIGFAAINGFCTYVDKKHNNGYTTEQRWEMAEELKENYTIYVDGEKQSKDFDIDGLSHAKFGIEINIDKKAIYFYSTR